MELLQFFDISENRGPVHGSVSFGNAWVEFYQLVNIKLLVDGNAEGQFPFSLKSISFRVFEI